MAGYQGRLRTAGRWLILLAALLAAHLLIQTWGEDVLVSPLMRILRNANLIPDPPKPSTTDGMPHLHLHIAPQYMARMETHVQKIIRQNWMFESTGDEVPAFLSIDGAKPIKVKVRLKGDMADNVTAFPWSIRITPKKGTYILGMSKISLHRPTIRYGHLEAVFLRHLREEGILAPRYEYVSLSWNGQGPYTVALEEHFAKELPEAQRRRESVIMALDEENLWQQRLINDQAHRQGIDQNRLMDIGFRQVPLRVYEEKRILKNPQLKGLYREATGLLRGYVEGYLTNDQVFDMEKVGTWYALQHFWFVWHGSFWNNLRFYYNPVTRLFEPIGFDNNVKFNRPFDDEPVVRPFYLAQGSETYWRAYRATLGKLQQEAAAGTLYAKLDRWETELCGTLFRHYFSTPAAAALGNQRLRFLAGCPARREGPDRMPRVEAPVYPRGFILASFVYVYYVEEPTGAYLEFINTQAQAVTVEKIYLLTRMLKRAMPIKDQQIVIPPNADYAHRIRIPVPKLSDSLQDEYRVVASLNEANRHRPFSARRTFPAFQHPKYTDPEVSTLLSRHPGMRRDGNDLVIDPGSWDLTETLVIPESFRLRIGPGTTLRLGNGVRLVARGGVDIQGRPGQPVRLCPLPGAAGPSRWGGLVVLNQQRRSSLRHCEVEGVAQPQADDWLLTGAVTLYGGEARIEQVRFQELETEDMLNLIRCRFVLEDCTFQNGNSDAVDVDFGDGVLARDTFQNIRGDALDISGSTVRAVQLRMDSIYDKGLSVGENSVLHAFDIRMNDVGTGIACKDGSRAWLANSRVDDAALGAFMAYMKKSNYAPALLTVDNTRLRNVAIDAAAVPPCGIVIDGVPQIPHPLDVDTMYQQGRMKKREFPRGMSM